MKKSFVCSASRSKHQTACCSAPQSVSCCVSSQLSAGVPRTPIRQRAELTFRETGMKTCRGRVMSPLQGGLWGVTMDATQSSENTRGDRPPCPGPLGSCRELDTANSPFVSVCPAPQVPPLPSAGKPHTIGLSDVCLLRKGAYLLF